MAYKQMNEDEWKKIGEQTEKVRKELFRLHGMATGKMPKVIVREITKSVNRLDEFKSKAEGRMFEMGDSDDLDIFFPFNNKYEI